MRAFFLNPPFKTEYGKYSRNSRSPAITKSGTNYYPVWLSYAAGVTEAAGHHVVLFDACAKRIDRVATLGLIQDFRPDLVVLDTSTPSILNDIEVGAAIKAQHPDCFVILMGTHPSSLPEETLGLNRTIDAIARGEADFTIREVAEKLSDIQYNGLEDDKKTQLLQNIEGLSFQVAGKIYHNRARPQIQDLDSLPFVSQIYKKYLDVRDYFWASIDYPEIQVMTARGCTDRCTFCVYPYAMHQLTYRMRSASNIVDEFAWIEKNLPAVKEVLIEDDTFGASIKRVHEFCEEKMRRNVKIKWHAHIRCTVTLDTLKLMRKAGCCHLSTGYESANQEVLDKMKKRLKVQSILDFSRNTKKAGIMVHGCFMVGNPGDTRQTLQESLNLALKLHDDSMQFFPLIVYPGTPDYEWAKQNNLMTVNSYDEWVTKEGLHNSVVQMPDMDSRQIVEWCDYARRRYYLRPRYLAYKAFQTIFRPSELVRNVRAGKRFVRFLLGGTFGRMQNFGRSIKNTVKSASYNNDRPDVIYPQEAPVARLVPRDYEKAKVA